MKRGIFRTLLLLLVGRGLSEAVDRHARAADDLDAAVKELLKR